MRKRRILVAAVATGTIALGAAGAGFATLGSSAAASQSKTATQAANTSRLGEAQIKQMALKFAATMGDPNPTAIEYAHGKRQQVVFAFSEDEVPDNTEVDAIVIHGRFVAKDAPVPTGESPPTGSVAILVVNAVTGEITDFGIQQETPNLSAFGLAHIAV
jgi:hypothetical protein